MFRFPTVRGGVVKARVRKSGEGRVRIETVKRSGATRDDLIVLSHSLREIPGVRHAYVRKTRIYMKATQLTEELIRHIKKLVFDFVPDNVPLTRRGRVSKAAPKRSLSIARRQAHPIPRLASARI